MIKDKQTAGANYLINFFNNIQFLNHSYSNYVNSLLELETKYGENPKKEDIDSNDLTGLIKVGQELRYHCHKVYIEYQSIFQTLKQTLNEQIINIYKSFIKKDLLVSREEIEKFVIEVNKVLVHDIIKDLLTTSQDIFNSIYGETKEGTTG